MSIDGRNTLTVGPTQTGVVILLFGNQVGADAQVERANDIGGTPGTYKVIATVTDVEASGTPFFDYLPLTTNGYWYRAKSTETGFEDSSYTEAVLAVPTLIPLIDWLSKPWLYDNSIPLQLTMDVVNETTGSLIVSASTNIDPVGLGTPVVSVESFFGVPSVTPSGSVWVITKPISGSGRVTFRNDLAGRLGDADSVDIGSRDVEATEFYSLVLTIVSSSASDMTVSASVENDFSAPYNISIAQTSVTTNLLSPNIWQLVRPTDANIEGTVVFQVTGSVAVRDTDTIYITKDELVRPSVRATVTEVGESSLTASLQIRDPYNTTGTLVGFTTTITSQSVAGLSVVSASQTNTGGTLTQVYHITRPNYGQGTGRVTWTATKLGYTRDSDSIEVPERVDGLARLRTVITPQGSTTTQQIVSVRVTDSIPLSGSYINLSSNLLGIPAITPTGSFLLSASEARQFTIDRPAYGAGIGRVTFTATASFRVSDSDAVDISERDISSQPAEAATITIGTITSGASSVNIPYSFDSSSTAQQVFVYAREATTVIDRISVEFLGTGVRGSPLYPNDGRTSLTLPISTPGNTIVATFVPFDALNRRGIIQTIRATSTVTPVTPPDPFLSSSLDAVGSNSVDVSVQMPASNLPDNIRVYLNGSPFGSLVTRVAGASAIQSFTVGGLATETSYTMNFSGVNTSGAESTLPLANLSFTTANGGTLDTPVVYFGGWEESGGGNGVLYFNIQNSGAYPSGTTFEADVYEFPGPTLLGSIAPTTSTTLTYVYPGPGSVVGEAIFRARRTGYNTSADSTAYAWNNTGGNDI